MNESFGRRVHAAFLRLRGLSSHLPLSQSELIAIELSAASTRRLNVKPLMPNLLDQLRWQKFPVLDDGFVCLVDVMGDDRAVVEAARVSYGAGTRRLSDDRTLIRYLMRHWHTTPFEMAELKLLVRVPMDCWRQWIRHRMASINETSTRYSVAIDAAQTTPADRWRGRPPESPRERGFSRPFGGRGAFGRGSGHSGARPAGLRPPAGIGRCGEQARKDLPLSTYTEAYWKVDLHNLLHFLHLRMEPHAQWEIRQYAQTIGQRDRSAAVSAGLGGVCRLPAGRGTIDPAGPGGDCAAGGRGPTAGP